MDKSPLMGMNMVRCFMGNEPIFIKPNDVQTMRILTAYKSREGWFCSFQCMNEIFQMEIKQINHSTITESEFKKMMEA